MRVAKFTIGIEFEIIAAADDVTEEDLKSEDIVGLKASLIEEWTKHVGANGSLKNVSVVVSLGEV